MRKSKLLSVLFAVLLLPSWYIGPELVIQHHMYHRPKPSPWTKSNAGLQMLLDRLEGRKALEWIYMKHDPNGTVGFFYYYYYEVDYIG